MFVIEGESVGGARRTANDDYAARHGGHYADEAGSPIWREQVRVLLAPIPPPVQPPPPPASGFLSGLHVVLGVVAMVTPGPVALAVGALDAALYLAEGNPEAAAWAIGAGALGLIGLGIIAKGAHIAKASKAAKAGGEGVDLFRHVSPGELADIQKSGVFRPGAGSMEGKWYAESAEHAQQWGNALNGGQGAVVTTRVPTSVADKMMRLEKLDGIGPARYADDLSLLNRTMDGIRVLP